MTPLEKLKRVEKLIEKLNEGDFILVVEGKRDVAALANIGITAKIITANGRPEGILKRISSTELKPVVLFDFDETGQERQSRFVELLLASDVVPEVQIRKEFKRIFGLRFFEEADKKLEEIWEKSEKTDR
ncbi:MAG: hypothetical protein Q8R15_02420 [Candidatus Micrarchaeota archaeon]|nr:hypothetical protein [Candidatus Micrarchaeota archaeon]